MSFEQHYLILDAIDRYRPRNQRALANFCGLSLGKTNAVIRKLVDQGLVKISASEGSARRRRNSYFLTAKGMEARAELSGFYIKVRMKEFEDFRKRLLENLLTLQEEGVCSLLVLGPQSVGNLLAHIARRENLVIRIVGTASTTDHFDGFDTGEYDRILFAEGHRDFTQLISEGLIPEDKVAYLK